MRNLPRKDDPEALLIDAVNHLRDAATALDKACDADPAICKRINAIPNQDCIEVIAGMCLKLALDARQMPREMVQ